MRSAALAATAALLALAAPAAAVPRAAWAPVTGAVPARVVDATRDGAGVALLSAAEGRLMVHRAASARIAGVGSVPATRPRTTDPGRARILRAEDGSLVVIWFERGGRRVLAATRPPGLGRRFGAPVVLSRRPEGTGAAAGLAVAQASDGRMLAVWWGGPAGGTLGVQASERGREGTWGAPVDAAAGTFPQGPTSPMPPRLDAEEDPLGGWIAAWSAADDELVAARRPGRSGPWLAPFGVAPPGSAAGRVAIDGAGDVTSAWTAAGPAGARCLHVARVPAGPATPEVRELACRPGGGSGEAVALLPTSLAGDAIVWSPGDGSALTLGRRSGAAAWSGPALAIAAPRGAPAGVVRLSAGRTLLIGGEGRRGPWRLVFVRPDGTVVRRDDGPATPGRVGASPRFVAAETAVPNPGVQGVMTWSTRSGTRMRVLTVTG